MTKGCVRTPPLEQRGESFVVRPLIARKAARAAQNGLWCRGFEPTFQRSPNLLEMSGTLLSRSRLSSRRETSHAPQASA